MLEFLFVDVLVVVDVSLIGIVDDNDVKCILFEVCVYLKLW